MRKLTSLVIVAAAAAGAAVATASPGPWLSTRTVQTHIRAAGVTLPNGTHTPGLTGACLGTGTRHGSLMSPTFRKFECLLRGGGHVYDLKLASTSAGLQVTRVVSAT